ncbi:large conductance mechanosensitive channel protein MscL [Corynebacterium choanae]|uniref:Large-conductance mechanosensitive channel n=1 Tax=Corynebacterium choanae TaxID=1862358 RepID=A0A3G6J8W7_9CORY|nr:large conductance mechanosensitive channel protein MscL [Corynebacterium choanae]AZA14507.1 Large-conductance mechanosensitive channel [Corynebacterium choanae]
MLKGFKDFIMRGNVIDLAVAVVIGAAFTSIVTAFTENLVNPIIASFGSVELGGLGVQLREGNSNTFIDLGAIITAAINFLIVAAIIYFIFVMPMNKVKERQAARQGVAEDEEEKAPVEVELLTEIRDLLRTRQL